MPWCPKSSKSLAHARYLLELDVVLYRLGFRFFQRWHNPQLLHQPQRIPHNPPFRDATTRDTMDHNAINVALGSQATVRVRSARGLSMGSTGTSDSGSTTELQGA